MATEDPTPLVGPAVEVDGHVIDPSALVARVDALLERIDSGEGVPGEQPALGLPALVTPVHEMRLLHQGIHPPELPTGGGVKTRSGGVLKRAVRRATSWYVEPRWQAQEQLDAKAIEFAAEAYNAVYRVEEELERLRQQNARLRLELVATTERFRRFQDEHRSQTEAVADLAETLAGVAMEVEVRSLAKEVAALLDRLGAHGATGAEFDYVEFERRFRGDPAVIAAAQRRYLSLFPPAELPGQVVDIGCGRGEMLELLAEEGHEVLGVDTDAGMVAACRERGVPAVLDDGLHFLAQTADDSLKGVFSAQVVEHLLTPELEAFVRESHRTLRRRGVLVIETINPRSSYALGNHYYADTSHVRPVHPETLRFLCEQVGFSDVVLEERSPHPLLALREELPEGPVGGAVEALLESVFGYQDYVVFATK